MQIKKALTLLLIAISTVSISTSCGLLDRTLGKYEKEKKKEDLSHLIPIIDLGEIKTENGKVSEHEVKNKLKALCPSVNIHKIKISIYNTLKEIAISSDYSDYYTCMVNLTFNPVKADKEPLGTTSSDNLKADKDKDEIDLSDIITNPDLGTIETSDHSGNPSKKEVENRLQALFPELILNGLYISIPRYPGKKIYIYADKSGYRPSWVELTYTTPTKRLKDIITNPDLGEINPAHQSGRPSEEEIKNLLQKLYKIEPEAINVYMHEDYPGYIMIMPNIFYGDYYVADSFEVILTYTTPKTNHSQDSDKTTFNLSEVDEAYKTLGIDKNASYEEGKKAFNRLALKYHPDKQGRNLTDAEKKYYNAEFDKVKKAWDVIRVFLIHNQFDEHCAGKSKKSGKAEVKF